MRKNTVAVISAALVCAALVPAVSFADMAGDAGIQGSRKMEGRYFKVYVEDGVDAADLSMRIAVPPAINALITEPALSQDPSDLTRQLDLLFLAVSEIMDIRLKDFKIKIMICRDARSLEGVFSKYFGGDLKTSGFYAVSLDMMYVDAENVDIHVLGHELSHAIQAHYFVVPPPAKIQEVLAGYVEYQLRKYTDSLPE